MYRSGLVRLGQDVDLEKATGHDFPRGALEEFREGGDGSSNEGPGRARSNTRNELGRCFNVLFVGSGMQEEKQYRLSFVLTDAMSSQFGIPRIFLGLGRHDTLVLNTSLFPR
jgi:hypothetical protein